MPFSIDLALPTVGANSLVASVSSSLGTSTSGSPVTDTFLASPPTQTLGTGVDEIVLTLAERAEPAGAQFTISVDGEQIGGVQTTTADTLEPGVTQQFDLFGDFAVGDPNTVTVKYLNASNSLLLVDSATLNGDPIANSNLVLSNDGTESFGFTGPADPTDTDLGSGPDSVSLFLAEQGQPAGAQFTVSIAGTQVGSVQTVTANAAAGQAQQYTVLGNFPSGTDPVTVTYLNPLPNSTLDVSPSASDGTALPQSEGFSLGDATTTGNFDIASPNQGVPTNSQTVGTSPDALTFTSAERAEPSGAAFKVSVDGQQTGGLQTTTADVIAGQFQQFTVLGDFAPGVNHTVSIDYLNAANSLLFIDNATINGSTIAGGSEIISNNGSLSFGFATPSAPGPTTIGSGPNTLALTLSEDYLQGNAQFILSVDGSQVGGAQAVSAIRGNGQSQVLDVLGNFSGAHTVSVAFLNPASDGTGTPGLVRNLYVGGATIDGTAIAGSTLALTTTGAQSFSFTH